MNSQLIKWDVIRHQIETAKDIFILKSMSDQLNFFEILAKQSKESLETQNKIAEYRLRVIKKIGEFSLELPTEKGKRTDLVHDGTRLNKEDTLRSFNISKQEANRYESIANLTEAEFENEIKTIKGLNKELTTAGILRFAGKLQQEHKKTDTPPMIDGEFNVLLADPPWKYDFSPTMFINIENHYPTMDIQEICDLKVPSADNAVLFLWATNPKLKEALEVMGSWGFEYKTNICWDKQKPTSSKMGYWFFGQHELLLVGTKGNFSPPKQDDRVASLYSELKTKHSKKPDYFYNLIERMFPAGKYLELFARKQFNKNWSVWGNQIPE